MSYTPGPWLDWEMLEWIHEPRKLLESADNARLIAAAPDLLEACKAAHEVLITFERLDLLKQDFEQQALESVRTAIAKAHGS